MTQRVCIGFAWIGQSIEHCDDCGHPAWDHVGMRRMKDGTSPFDCNEDSWEVRPWADDVVASWLKHGIINRQKAIALLQQHSGYEEAMDSS